MIIGPLMTTTGQKLPSSDVPDRSV